MKKKEQPKINKSINPETGKHVGGRPTKYDPKYCEELIAFFSVPKSKQVVKKEKLITKANGTTESEKEYVCIPEDLPTFEKFARNINVCYDTLISEWCKNHKEFSEAYNIAKSLQKEFLVDNGLAGLYPPASFIFVAKNITDMKDKQELEHSGDLTVIIRKLSDGNNTPK